jgi:hypothetical protein
MAVQTLAAADAILKDLYVGPIIEQINQKTYMIDQIERDVDSIDHTGRRAVIPLHTNRNRGRGSRGDNANLPVGGVQVYQDAFVPIRYHYYGMELTDPAIEATTSNEGAFVNLLDSETKGISTDMRKDINRQVFGDGTGLLTSVRAANTAGLIPVNSVQYIGIGDTVDVVVRSTGATGNGVVSTTVTARDTTAGAQTITVSPVPAGALDTTYGIFLAGSYGKEMDGLVNISATVNRTLHGINSATAGNEFWNPQVIPAGAAIAGETLFERLADNVNATGQATVETFVTTRGIRRRLADTYQSQKRFNDARAVDVHGGYTAIMVNEVAVVADDDCPKGYAFGFDKSAFRWFQQTSPGWLEQRDGGIFHLKDGSTAQTKMNVWQAWFRWYVAFGAVAPNRSGALTGCDDDAAL